jgi:hypothetical protein
MSYREAGHEWIRAVLALFPKTVTAERQRYVIEKTMLGDMRPSNIARKWGVSPSRVIAIRKQGFKRLEKLLKCPHCAKPVIVQVDQPSIDYEAISDLPGMSATFAGGTHGDISGRTD